MSRRTVKVCVPESELKEKNSNEEINSDTLNTQKQSFIAVSNFSNSSNISTFTAETSNFNSFSSPSLSPSSAETLKKHCHNHIDSAEMEVDHRGQTYARLCSTCLIPNPCKVSREQMNVLRRNSFCASATLVRLELFEDSNDKREQASSIAYRPVVNRSYSITVIPQAHEPRSIFSVNDKDRGNLVKSKCAESRRSLEVS